MRFTLVALMMLLAPASMLAQPAGMPPVGGRAAECALPGATRDTFPRKPVDPAFKAGAEEPSAALSAALKGMPR
jgi:hypothetical protein